MVPQCQDHGWDRRGGWALASGAPLRCPWEWDWGSVGGEGALWSRPISQLGPGQTCVAQKCVCPPPVPHRLFRRSQAMGLGFGSPRVGVPARSLPRSPSSLSCVCLVPVFPQTPDCRFAFQACVCCVPAGSSPPWSFPPSFSVNFEIFFKSNNMLCVCFKVYKQSRRSLSCLWPRRFLPLQPRLAPLQPERMTMPPRQLQKVCRGALLA